MPEAGRAAWKIARDTIAGLDPYEKDLAREIVDSLIVENVCGETAALPIEELKSLLPIVASSATGEYANDAGRPRLVASTGGLHRRRDSSRDRCCPVRSGRRGRARTCGIQLGARARAGIRSAAHDRARSRESRRAPQSTRRLDGACGRRSSAHARGAYRRAERGESRDARGEQHGDRGIYRAGGVRRGCDARGGCGSILSGVGNPDRRRIRTTGGCGRIDPADARDARVPGRDRIARRAGRTRHQGKRLATIGDHFIGDRVRTAAGRAWPANPDGSAAQSRRVGGAFSEIQMDLRAVLPERACAMD